MRPRLLSLLVVALVATSANVHAQDAASAQALFDEGRRLLDAGRYAEACPKFEASQKVDPALGTLMNLADCLEKQGRVASAWLRFKEVLAEAQHQRRADREHTARDRIAALEPRLPKMAVAVTSPVDGETILRDGVRIDSVVYGIPVAVDPGAHEIVAKAPGRHAWATNIDVPTGSGVTPVTVPALEVDEASLAMETTNPPPQTGRGNGQRIAGLTIVGVGVVAVVIGSVFGSLASSKWSDAQKDGHCIGSVCDATGFALANDAKTMANLSTGLFIGGAVTAVAGLVVFLVAPRAHRAAMSLRFGALGGTF